MSSKLILFDFDGTIADSLETLTPVINTLAEKYGFERVSEDAIGIFRTMGAREVLSALKIPMWKLPWIVRDVHQAFGRMMADIPLVPGIHEVLDELHSRGYTIGILTSNSQQNVKAFLEYQKVNSIDFIQGNVGLFGKSRHIVKAVKVHHAEKSQVLYVGDEIRDIEAAQKAGVIPVAVTWGFTSEERLQVALPHALIRTPEDLLRLFLD